MRPLRSQAGMSLVEVVVATAIIAVALAPLISVFLTSQKSVEGAAKRVEAMALARSAMDEVLHEDYHSLTIGTYYSGPHSLNADYTLQVTVGSATTYMKSITVVVGWTEKGQAKTVTLVSTVSQRTAAP